MVSTGATLNIREEAEKAREAIPAKYRAPAEASLLAKFDPATMKNGDEAFLNPQELRNLALRIAKIETEEELRAALSGVLSGRMLENFFKHRDEALQKAAKEQRKARDDMYYMALLQAQLDDLNRQIAGYDKRLGDIDTFLSRIEAGESFDVGRDGRLLDEELERLLIYYEERTKVKVDRHNLDEVREALKDEREFIKDQKKEALDKKTKIQDEIDARPEAVQQEIKKFEHIDMSIKGSKISFAGSIDSEGRDKSLNTEFKTAALGPTIRMEPQENLISPKLATEASTSKPNETPVVFNGFANG